MPRELPRDGSSCVRAVVRVRPLLRHELDKGAESCCEVPDAQSMLIRSAPGSSQWRKYAFDATLPSDRSQKQVFQECGAAQLVDSAANGYSATILAYGQTGSGKTHTMMGRLGVDSGRGDEVKKDDGMIMRAAKRLFRRTGSNDDRDISGFSVGCSFAEIFNAPGAVNECICDLLNPDSGNLQVRSSQKQGFFIENLAVFDCKSVADVRNALEAGLQNRRVSAHALNKDSSRSHALFTLYIDSEGTAPGDEDGPSVKRYGKITFVDLAGSERLKDSLSEGNARKETQAINKSLFTLGQVISQLAKGETRHVPYRNSKLTVLLQESFGGEALCLMVTCISPSFTFAEESSNSLNYAQKAMTIQNCPVVRLDEQQRVLFDLRAENAALRRELESYRARFGVLTPRGSLLQGPEMAPEIEQGGSLMSGVLPQGDARPSSASCSVLCASPGTLALPSSSPTRSLRGRSLPPPDSPKACEQLSPVGQRPPRPAPVGSSPLAPQHLHSAPSSAREAAAMMGSYAQAAAKRQQLKQPPPPRRRPSNGGQAGKQLPPLPSRGSTAQSDSSETTNKPTNNNNNNNKPTNNNNNHNNDRNNNNNSNNNSNNDNDNTSAEQSSASKEKEYGAQPDRNRPPESGAVAAVSAAKAVSGLTGRASPSPSGGHATGGVFASPTSASAAASQLLRRSSSSDVLDVRALQLTSEQLDRLDRAHWSEWQVEFDGQIPDPRGPGTASASHQGSFARNDSDPQRASGQVEDPRGRGRRPERRESGTTSSATSTSTTPPHSMGAGSRQHEPSCARRPPDIGTSALKSGSRVEGPSAGSASTASGTPMDQARQENGREQMSLADLNSKLSSMQQATSSLLQQRPPD